MYVLKINGETILKCKDDFKPIKVYQYIQNHYGMISDKEEVYGFEVKNAKEFLDSLFFDCKRYLIYREKERYNTLKRTAYEYGDINREWSDKLKQCEKWSQGLDLIDSYINANPILLFKRAWNVVKPCMKWDGVGQTWDLGAHKELLVTIVRG